MLSLKRSVSALSRASSSKTVLSAAGTTSRRFYAQDSSSNGNNNAANAGRSTIDDILEPARRSAPDLPPRAPSSTSTANVQFPPTNRVRPAQPVGIPAGTANPRLELPERPVQDSAKSPHDEDFDVKNIDPSGVHGDEATKKAAKVFAGRTTGNGKGEKNENAIQISTTYRLYTLAKRKNCIMTLVDGDNKIVARTSSGACGFKNSAEGSYEAGYQCAMRIFYRLREQIEKRSALSVKIEVYLNGFGQGRGALLKALTMPEGEGIRQCVSKLIDTTPIKVGGMRLQKERRL